MENKMRETLKIRLTHKNAVIPTRVHPDDAGLDLTITGIVTDLSPCVTLYDTGIAVQPPEGFYTQVVARSSTSKLGISLASGTGIIDPSFRGSIKLAIRFHEALISRESLIGRRIGQLLIKPLHIMEVEEVDSLDDSIRGAGGFGSTGE
jgi:dUTP pyrophosphatase